MSRFLTTILFIIILSKSASSQNIDSIVRSGILQRNSGDFELAVKAFEKVLAFDKLSSDANYEMAYTYITSNKNKQALKYCNRIIRNNLNNKAKAYLLKGSALDNMGKYNKSIKVYKKALTNYPNDYLLNFNLGICYHNKNKLKEAESQYIKSIKIDKLEPSSHYMLGVLMSDKGDRVKSMLSLYFFLLLEPNTDRSLEAVHLLFNQWNQNVKVIKTDTDTLRVSIASRVTNNSLDLEISSIFARKIGQRTQSIDESEILISNTQTLFGIIGKYRNCIGNSIWEDIYLDFFLDLVNSNQVEPFSYYATSICDNALINSWLESNQDQIQYFSTWASSRLRLHSPN